MNTSKIAAIVLAGLVIIMGGVWLMQRGQEAEQVSSSDDQSSVDNMRQEYPDLPENHRFIVSDADGIIDRLENGTGIVFLGFKECPWCQKLAPIVNEAAEAESVNVYYYDIRSERSENTETYQSLIDKLGPYLRKDEDGSPRIYVPDVTIVNKGEIVWRHQMEIVLEAESKPDTYWTEARRSEKVSELRQQIQGIKTLK